MSAKPLGIVCLFGYIPRYSPLRLTRGLQADFLDVYEYLHICISPNSSKMSGTLPDYLYNSYSPGIQASLSNLGLKSKKHTPPLLSLASSETAQHQGSRIELNR